jgi:hypothetical protein
MPDRPILKDTDAWQKQLAEHRRILFERLIAEFPEILKTKRTHVEIWRHKLR